MALQITARQREVMQYIESFSWKHDRTPTYTELNTKFEWTSDNTARCILESLERKGYIKRSHGRHRNIIIIKSAFDGERTAKFL